MAGKAKSPRSRKPKKPTQALEAIAAKLYPMIREIMEAKHG